jgi:LysR family transcriptional regulator, hypochlorite-specific transcription factor HypT
LFPARGANARFGCFDALDEPPMNFNFTWLEDFLAVAATGNFSRAAEDRHSSQPAFSRRIRSLEEWIGAPLVDRSTQPARLTEVGEWFKGVAADLVARAARLPGDAQKVAEASAGTLRIASTHALSFTFLPRWLRSLESKVAIGPVALTSDVLARCEAQMQEGKVHFVLAHAQPKAQGTLDSQTYVGVCIGHDQLVPACKPNGRGQPSHQLVHSRGKEMVPILAYSEESGMGRVVRAVLGRRLEGIPCHTVFIAHLASVLRSMAIDGRGIAWLPRTLIEDDLAAGRLVIAADSPWSIDLEIRLYRQREKIGGSAEAFWQAATGNAVSDQASTARRRRRP